MRVGVDKLLTTINKKGANAFGGVITGSSDIILMGKKKPEAFAPGPAGQGGVNTDGTWNIRG